MYISCVRSTPGGATAAYGYRCVPPTAHDVFFAFLLETPETIDVHVAHIV